jgi:hypothetical protein
MSITESSLVDQMYLLIAPSLFCEYAVTMA